MTTTALDSTFPTGPAVEPPIEDEHVRIAVLCAVDLSVVMLLRTQLLAMKAAGHWVEVVCSDGPYVAQLRAEGFPVHTISISRAIQPMEDFRAISRLASLFRRRRFTVIHTHTPKAAFLGQLAAKLARVPVRVNTIHGLYYLAAPPGWQRTLFKALEILACRLAHHVFSQSGEDVAMILREGLLEPEKIEFLGNGIDLDRFNAGRFDPDMRNRVRDEFNIPRDAFVVGVVARMVNEKGFRELLEALARFRKIAPNAYLLHVGFVDRSRRDEVTPDLAAKHGVAEFCRFVGQRPDVDRIMLGMDVFCLPSYREGYPRSVMEANAMGLPVIVTNIRGCREAVIDGVNGLLVPVRQVEPLVDALKRLYEDTDLRQRLAAGAIQRAKEQFDERHVIAKTLDIYDVLLQRPKRWAALAGAARARHRRLRAANLALIARRQRSVLIVVVLPSTVEVFLTEQIQAMRRAGYDAGIVARPDAAMARLEALGFPFFPIFMPRSVRPLTLLKALVRLCVLFIKRRPDLIHTHTPVAAFLGQIAAYVARVPRRVTTVHGLYYLRERRSIIRFIYKTLEVVACRLATKVISVSSQDTRYLLETRALTSASRIETLHVGVNLNVFSPDRVGPDARQNVRRELDIPQDAFVFGIVGRMVREKGFREMFEAFGRLIKRYPNIYLMVVGPVDTTGGDEVVLPEEAGRYGCAHHTRFAGMRLDVARFLAAMDVFCLPTYREGYPVSVMEAAAMGLPCIVTDIRGCREAVVYGVTGLIIPPRHAAALEQAMESLLLSPERREAMGRAALQRAREFFDRRRVVERTLQIYEDEFARREPWRPLKRDVRWRRRRRVRSILA
jgi:glycosyltransferase involved in cell wall biosynthesis